MAWRSESIDAFVTKSLSLSHSHRRRQSFTPFFPKKLIALLNSLRANHNERLKLHFGEKLHGKSIEKEPPTITSRRSSEVLKLISSCISL